MTFKEHNRYLETIHSDFIRPVGFCYLPERGPDPLCKLLFSYKAISIGVDVFYHQAKTPYGTRWSQLIELSFYFSRTCNNKNTIIGETLIKFPHLYKHYRLVFLFQQSVLFEKKNQLWQFIFFSNLHSNLIYLFYLVQQRDHNEHCEFHLHLCHSVEIYYTTGILVQPALLCQSQI